MKLNFIINRDLSRRVNLLLFLQNIIVCIITAFQLLPFREKIGSTSMGKQLFLLYRVRCLQLRACLHWFLTPIHLTSRLALLKTLDFFPSSFFSFHLITLIFTFTFFEVSSLISLRVECLSEVCSVLKYTLLLQIDDFQTLLYTATHLKARCVFPKSPYPALRNLLQSRVRIHAATHSRQGLFLPSAPPSLSFPC